MELHHKVVLFIFQEVRLYFVYFIIASNLTIKGSTLNNNWAALSGGALFATGFKFLNIVKQCSFTGNQALSFGADIDASISSYNMLI